MWNWLVGERDDYSWGFVARVLGKAMVLFGLCNVIYGMMYPASWLGSLSLYGTVFPYRTRLPYSGDNAPLAYNLTVDSLPVMFASHELSRPKAANEFRVVMIGDSSTWGWYLQADETYASVINEAELVLSGNREVVTYNLGYPVLSLTKDLILLDEILRYEPDMVLWLVTAQSFQPEVQTSPPVSEWSPLRLNRLISAYDLSLAPRATDVPLWERTLIANRVELGNLLRLQLYGSGWAATKIDHHIPADYALRRTDLEASEAWGTFSDSSDMTNDDLAFDVLAAGVQQAGNVPVIVVNQPIFVSSGENSDLRYNSFYPRWAYDQYRDLLSNLAQERGWTYYDLWDALPPTAFTDTPVHVTPEAAAVMGQALGEMILTEYEEADN